MDAILEQVRSATGAYYDAFAACDLPAVMACWACHDDVSCVAPLFDPAFGPHDVEGLYRKVFEIIAREVFTWEVIHTAVDDPVAVVTCVERAANIAEGHANEMLSSTILVLGPTGWRIHHRHVSWRSTRTISPGRA